MKVIPRRDFLASLSATAAALPAASLLLPRVARSREVQARLTAQPLSENLLLIQGAGCNVVVLRNESQLVFVDGGLKAHGRALLSLAHSTLGTRAAGTLINTHWHPEHTGLNELLGMQHAELIAHENTRLWLSTSVRYEPDGPPIGPLPRQARPTKTTRSGGELPLATETLQYAHLPQAHTDGDLYVKFARANVLVTGGVVAGNGWPTADWVTGGWINGTVAGYRTLIAQCDAATRVITAHGERLYTREDLRAEAEILSKIADQLARMMRAGYGPEDMLAAAPARDYSQRLGDPTRFLTESFRSLWPRLAPDA